MTNPKTFIREPSRTGWYLTHPRYMKHMAQELTSVFVGAYALLMLCALRAIAGGKESWDSFLASLGQPLMLVFLWVTLAATLYHTITWFAVTPKAMPIQLGDHFVPGKLIAGAHYAAWLAASLIILYLAGAF